MDLIDIVGVQDKDDNGVWTRQSASERFAADFVMGGVAAVVAKSAAAPIERVKLLMQSQGELIKSGHLSQPYHGIGNCFARVLREEGVLAFWRGNYANAIRYFPTQVGVYFHCLEIVLWNFRKMFCFRKVVPMVKWVVL